MPWYKQWSCINTPEGYSPGEHKTYEQLREERRRGNLQKGFLESGRNGEPYDNISDFGKALSSNSYNIEIRHLRHATDANGFFWYFGGWRILRRKKIIKEIRYPQSYSWWSAHYDSDEFDEIFMGDIPSGHRPAPLFLRETHIYGNYVFQYDVEDLLREYYDQFCKPWRKILKLRILGTFVYKQEIMHAVLVHSSGFDDLFQHLPLVLPYEGNRIQYQGPCDQLYWTPQSVLETTRRPYSTWEHLSFAFYTPKNNPLFEMPDLKNHGYYVGQ